MKRNLRGIFRNFTLTRRLTPILLFLFGAPLIGPLLTPSFNKIQSLISVALNGGITFLVRAVCFPFPHEENIDCVTSLRNVFVQARFPFLSFLPIYIVRSPRFIPSPCFILSPQSAVRILYLVRVLYPVCSPHFIPSPCFIPSPQSVVRSPSFILTVTQTSMVGLAAKKTNV